MLGPLGEGRWGAAAASGFRQAAGAREVPGERWTEPRAEGCSRMNLAASSLGRV